MTEQIIKCKFCDWTHKAGWRNKDCTYRSGYSLLKKHVEFNHPKEFKAIQDRLDEREGRE